MFAFIVLNLVFQC